MKNTVLKRLLSAILSLAMVLSIVAIPVLAEEADTVIYYDNSASLWAQVFVSWAGADSNEVAEIFDADGDGLYEVLIPGGSAPVSFGPSAELSQHPLWLTSVTAGEVYRYTPPVAEAEEEPTEPEVTEEPTEPEVTEEPTEPEATEEPTEPEVTEEPTEPETTEEPTEPEVTEEPTEPEATEEPTEPEATEEPTEPEVTEEPTEPEVTEEPTEPEVTEEPTEPEATEETKPACTGEEDCAAEEHDDGCKKSAADQVIRISHRWINPLYGDLTELPPIAADEQTTWDLRQVYHTDTASAGAELRGALVDRTVTVRIGYQMPADQLTDDGLVSAAEEIFDLACAHTGVPNEGDYLLLHLAGWNMYMEYMPPEGDDTYADVAFTYHFAFMSSAEQEAIVDQQVASLLADLAPAGTDYEKLKTVYDWICDNIVYDYAHLNDESYLLQYSAYAALVQKTAVCQGYSNLLYRLALEMGIDCRIITGFSHGERHSWNIVKLDGQYYNVDATWDAEIAQTGEYYGFFLKCEANFPDHARDEQYRTAAFMAQYPMAGSDYILQDAPYEYVDGDFVFIIDGNTATLVAYTGNAEEVTIPDTANGIPVTILGATAFMRNTTITKVTLPASIAEIEDGSFETIVGYYSAVGTFAFCKNLETVSIPTASTLTNIGVSAFTSCERLASITIPASVTNIGNGVFYYCRSLTSITIPDGVTSIGRSAFGYCSGLTSITIPDSVTSIGSSAFESCSGLESIIISDGVTSIEDSTFYTCSRLTSITIPDGVTRIGEHAFAHCYHLNSITIPDSVTSIEEHAFTECVSLTAVFYKGTEAQKRAVTIGKTNSQLTSATWHYEVTEEMYDGQLCYHCGKCGLLYWPDGTEFSDITWTLVNGVLTISGIGPIESYEKGDAFRPPWYSKRSEITSVVIGSGITGIGTYAFDACDNLTTVSIPDSITRIGNYAFQACSSLTSIKIPDGVTNIENYTFQECSSLTSIKIPDGVTNIGTGAFQGCSSLTSIDIPDSVTRIGRCAFQGGSSLTSIDIPDGVTSIEWSAFQGCSSLTSIDIPDSVTSIEPSAFEECSSLTAITIPDGVTAIGNSAFSGCSSLTSVTIPNSVTAIGYYAFCNCSSLTSIAIPDSVTSIGWTAFSHCSSLTSVTIPDSVTAIETSTFSCCYSLTSVTIPSSVTAIGNWAFSHCSSLTSIAIPDSVTSIGRGVFMGCNGLTGITIPDSVTSIGDSAFSDCYGLTSVFYKGTEVQKNAISIVSGNNWLTDATWHYEITEEVQNGELFYRCGKCGLLFYPDGTQVPDEIQAPTVSVSNVASTGKIKLSWNAVSGAAKYKVYRSTSKNGTYSLLSTTTGTQLTNTSVTAGTTYYYYVIAVSGSGASSEKSNTVSCTCDLPRPTVTVTNVESSGKPKVSWNAVSGATKYTLYIYDANGNQLKTSSTTGTSITHSSAVAGTSYTYKVKALCGNSAATSAFSEAKSITCDLARPTVTVSIVASSGKPKISWTAVSGATKYTVYIYDWNGELLKTSSTSSTSLTHSSAEVGINYTYKVKALCGVSAATSAFSAAKSITCDLARPTVTVSNVASSGKPKVSWNKVSGATKYTLYIYDADDTLLKTLTLTGTSVTHSSAVVGTNYTYKVKALCGVSAATSAFSAAKSRTCDLARPTATVALNTSGKPVLTWGKVSGATKYTVYIYDESGALLKTSTTTGTKLTHSSAVKGTTYSYCVIAVSSVSAANSAKSTSVSIEAR